jgi:Tfp pilus assembly protein PilX
MQKRNTSAQGGFALLVVMGAVILFIVLAATTAYMVSRLQKMGAGQARYTAATDAADAGIELGVLEISNAADDGRTPNADTTVAFGRYNTNIEIELLERAALPSGSLEMASAYEGIGTGAGSLGVAGYYLINTTSTDPTATEQGRLQSMRRKLVGGQ